MPLQKHSEPVQKIAIVPRTMGALGYVMNVPEEEKYLSTKKELEARLVELMGGRAAEEIVLKLLLPVLPMISSRPPTWQELWSLSTVCLKIRSYGS